MTKYPHDKIVPFKTENENKKKQVEHMFDQIAFRYDFLNRFLSVGIDRIWRKKAIRQLAHTGAQNILDVATGTGDFAINCFRQLQPQKVTGIDISEGMLEIGRKKVQKLGLADAIELLKGDSENLQFEDNTFDAATVAFGVRNFENLEKGLSEILRVLKPGSRLVVLEFTRPSAPVVKQLYKFYMQYVTPAAGKIFSKNSDAYQYLNDSVFQFPEKQNFVNILNQVNYRKAFYKTLTFGICTIYCAEK